VIFINKKLQVGLTELFNDKITNKKVLGSWLSGIYTVQHGEEIEKDFGYKEFELSEYTFLRIDKGLIVEKYTVSKDFDLKNIPDDASPGLKKIIEELNTDSN